VPRLKVQMIEKPETYRDLARIPWKLRMDKNGAKIPEGRICKVSVNGRSCLLSCRGRLNENEPLIFLDGTTRRTLGLKVDQLYDFELRPVRWPGQFLWAWRASDPLYRIAARAGLISVGFGVLGIVLGLAGLLLGILSLCAPKH
jgi:hypothetical protein